MSTPLSIALPTSSIKTAMPLIGDKTWVKVKLASVGEENHVEDGQEALAENKKPFIIFKVETTDNVASSEGKIIEPGKPGSFLSERIYLRDKNNLTSVPEMAGKKVGQIMDAFDNTGDADNTKGLAPRKDFSDQWVAESVGKVCMVEVVIDGEYGNKIKQFKSCQDKMFQVA